MPLPVLVGISFIVGAIAGVLILMRMVLISVGEPKLALQWAIAGALAGSITLIAIVLIYRKDVSPQD